MKKMIGLRLPGVVMLVAGPGLLTLGAAWAGTPSLDWLAGRWCMDSGNRQIEEVWLPEVGGQLLGMARTVRDGKVVGFEYMRIESEEPSTRFIAQPGGVPPTTFTASEVSENLLVVENPQHDFPQKVVYRRNGEDLLVTISGPGEDGQVLSVDFSYQACKD